jgi:hypothetical protein
MVNLSLQWLSRTGLIAPPPGLEESSQALKSDRRLGDDGLNFRTALLGLFVALTIVFALTTAYESGVRSTFTSTNMSTVTATNVSTVTVTATSVSTTTTTSTVDPDKALVDAYASHLGAIESRNATALTAQYAVNATLLAVIAGTPMNGSFHGVANITGFYAEAPTNIDDLFHALQAPFAVANETHSTAILNNETAGNVTSRLVFYGNDSVSVAEGGCYFPNIGPCAALAYTVEFDISYVLQSNHWLISTESVTYVDKFQCLTVTVSPDGSVMTCHGFS